MNDMDQFDNLEKHTQSGIEFVDRYSKFVKERSEIETSYAKQIRSLSKKYQPKKNSREDEENNLCVHPHRAERLRPHEVISENLTTNIVADLVALPAGAQGREESARQQAQLRHQAASDSKSEYAAYLQKFNQEQNDHYYTIIPNVFQCMRTFADVDRQVLPIVGKCLDGMTKAAESIEAKADSKLVVESYKSGFEPPGDVDFEDYGQAMKRTASETSLSNSGRDSREREKPGGRSKGKLWPFIKNKNKLMSLLTSPHQPPPAPPASPPPSPSAVPNDPQSPKQHKEPLAHRLNDFMASKPKMHCLRSLRRGLMSLLTLPPPPASPPPSPSNDPQSPKQHKEPLAHRLNDFMASKPKMHCLRSLRRGGSGPEDFSHLPPEQRRKKLQGKIDELNKEIQKEMDQRDALTKMKDVYMKNPQMGDPASVDPRLAELAMNIEKLQSEVQKFEVRTGHFLNTHVFPLIFLPFSLLLLLLLLLLLREEEAAGLAEEPRCNSLDCLLCCGLTELNKRATACEEQEQEEDEQEEQEEEEEEEEDQQPSCSFDDEFEDEETLPTIGTCKALYPFDGHNEGTISVAEGELLFVIEEDKGDGWTRVRRNEEEEGYVPSSYVEVFLENPKDS
ncbi:LOW QUALITY PROTEIN: hypothetical protein CRUP_030892 [Coryphaenoides rupestris]|nr:LOW QUALITY PROTEIN: hypothetical protein CRUP_030892 [Coryphaenoides rupestris]